MWLLTEEQGKGVKGREGEQDGGGSLERYEVMTHQQQLLFPRK